MENGYINIQQAADILCLSKAHIYRLTSRRKIPFMKLGQRVVFDPEKLRQWAESHAVAIEG